MTQDKTTANTSVSKIKSKMTEYIASVVQPAILKSPELIVPATLKLDVNLIKATTNTCETSTTKIFSKMSKHTASIDPPDGLESLETNVTKSSIDDPDLLILDGNLDEATKDIS